MKKELIYYALLALVIIALIAYQVISTKNESRIIKVEAFEKIKVEVDCQIFVSRGEEQKVVIEGPAPYLDRIEVQMDHGMLVLSEKEQGLTSQIFGTYGQKQEKISLYLRIRSNDELIVPDKTRLISNEKSLRVTESSAANLSPFQPFEGLFRLITARLATINYPVR